LPGALLAIATLFALTGVDEPNVEVLSARFDREKSPVWADGDAARFFYRGEAKRVEVIAGGDFKSLTRIPSSDVWTVAVKLPDLERAVISYYFTVTKNGSRPNSTTRMEGVWRGPKAPEPAAETAELRGLLKTVEIESNSLGMRRKLTVYLAPGFEPTKPHRVIYAADGEGTERFARVLEPLIVASKLPPMVMVGIHGGGYEGGAPDFKDYDTKKDFRAQEYFPGINPARFAKHQKFFCSEVARWAEREYRISGEANDRVLFGCSNGARFVFEMAMRHPDRYGSVLAFSVPGGGPITLPQGLRTKTRFYFEAGTWEQNFLEYTSRLSRALDGVAVAVQFRSRAGGHDEAIWREEFARALLSAFGTR
jgi:enterochelin esterase-like enzyme